MSECMPEKELSKLAELTGEPADKLQLQYCVYSELVDQLEDVCRNVHSIMKTYEKDLAKLDLGVVVCLGSKNDVLMSLLAGRKATLLSMLGKAVSETVNS